MAKKSILVTGGAGFLGSHLCEKLLSRGNRVLCIDNFSTGNQENLSSFLSHPHFTLIRHDVSLPLKGTFSIDEIYNLASPASPMHYQEYPLQTLKTNFLGALHMLELAKKTNAKILQASTSEIYGDPLRHPQKENYWGNVNPIGPRACYDEGKRIAETLFFDFARNFSFPIKVARIFNTYGPRMSLSDGRVISNFIIQALKGEELTVYGEGKQSRSFCYVDDLIEGLISLMETPNTIQGPINLGNPLEFSILNLAHKILKMTSSSSKITFRPLPIDDPKQRRPDISLAKKLLRWNPTISLEKGLERTISYFSDKLHAKSLS